MKKFFIHTLIGLSVLVFYSGCASGLGIGTVSKKGVSGIGLGLVSKKHHKKKCANKNSCEESSECECKEFSYELNNDCGNDKTCIDYKNRCGKKCSKKLITFVVTGEGVAPVNTISPAQAVALAKRAAITDAYRQLAEKIYGIRINAKETVKDAALQNSRIVTQVDGLIRNADITDTSYKDGLFLVTMEISMEEYKWKKMFSHYR